MTTITLGGSPADFIWASGIEDTFVPQTRPGMRALDEYELMGHYQHWREDLALGRDLGLQAIRWGVPWYRVEPEQGVFDWSWTDEVIPYMVQQLGITPIIDLMHYGCPLWLQREFANSAYPQAVAAYSAAFAERYKHLVRWYTPLNEPIVNALMCGRRGLWPPYLRGDTGYLRVMLQLARGIVHTVRAIKAVDPDALMVHVEATSIVRAARPDLQALADDERLRNFLALDLVTGKVTPEHPLSMWLLRNGAPPDVLAELAVGPIALDVLGLNFYPQWCTQQIFVSRSGKLAYRIIEKDGAGFAALVEDYYRRYGAPVMITETSALGTERARSQWLTDSLAAIKRLRAGGVPVLGYTWFPMFTMIDWRYRHGTLPLERYHLDLGLYNLSDQGPRWQASPLVEQFRMYMANPQESVGALVL